MKGQMTISTGDKSPPTKADADGSFGWRVIVRALLLLFLPLVLFVAAGRLDWWQAWAVVIAAIFFALLSRLILWRQDPALLSERAQYTRHEDVPGWDRVLLPLISLAGPLLIWLVAGLDQRWGWSPPIALTWQLAALLALILAYAFGTWAMVVNKFFSAVVRIQTERSHTVVSSGPYQFVRHPGYAGGIITNLAMAILLGSLWALIPAGLTVSATILRTAFEDSMLRTQLAGYAAYADRVRYRLLPGVW